jgi:imidazole glycerol-phosphate synthase subunit HisH
MVGIIDYGMGNLLSVKNALEYLGASTLSCVTPADIESVDRIILPGVGAFQHCAQNLLEAGFIGPLNDFALVKKKPIMGICLGMQIMAEVGFEHGEWKGLGWFESKVVNINEVDDSLKVPHVGWTDTQYSLDSPLFKGLPKNPDFYFVHSYYMKFEGNSCVDAFYKYKSEITAAVRHKNICGTQFHPEKSQDNGLKVLNNFLDWNP